MGSEIHKEAFTEQDYQAFEDAWLSELAFVQQLFTENGEHFSESKHLGYELEACILDAKYQPAPINQKILSKLDPSLFTNELANYDLEINGSIFNFGPSTPIELKQNLMMLCHKAGTAAKKFDSHLGLFGVFPKLMPEHFDPKQYQSDMRRYTLASQRIYELRHESIHVLLHGEDEVKLDRDDVMSEALCTSLQIHFQVPFSRATEYYHAALIASVIMVGFGANASLVLGKRAWHESRIPIFEQSTDARDQKRREKGDEKRVHFAHGYINSWLDLFEQNKDFKILFPDVVDAPVEKLYHFNLHNGTIWRWIRPIISQGKDGKWGLRMELRVLPAGPTLIDIQTNLWFFIGLIEGLVKKGIDLTLIPFEVLKNDFYHIAKYGMQHTFHEPLEGQTVVLNEWISQEGLNLAKEGFESLGVKDMQPYLDIIQARARTGQNGAVWQLKHFEKHNNINKLVEDYMTNFEADTPVHQWSL
ncbi:hypothetical protein PGH07_00810 [Sulfurovum sp. zt1-1]|uniref:Glutamate--cysteine ligase n=1 Tax=Sulfurovum zhangzhouensis TaxID=3019067 RepID=A0ABT7QVZ6_9BACT|nr:hypothetical protein [Sulfurovum zhangzhouensis]MDM5270714.1 hypothetical protein [Sulfurovum zhangzhouensis]